jgi:hypothetical protein
MRDHDETRRPGEADGEDASAGWVEAFRRVYHPPPEVPRDEMWAAIESGIRAERAGSGPAADVVAIDRPSARRRAGRPRMSALAWGAAAAAVLALGVGLGRWTAPVPGPGADRTAGTGSPTAGSPAVEASSVEVAARRHLGRAEPLLLAVRTDSRTGHLDASVGPWTRALLLETRLLLDARPDRSDEMQRLLADLELVLMEILGAVEGSGIGEERLRTETELAVKALDEREMLPRIRSALPATMSGR